MMGPEYILLEGTPTIAPCVLGKDQGEVNETDPETGDGVCTCGGYRCLVDGKNIVQTREEIPGTTPQRSEQ